MLVRKKHVDEHPCCVPFISQYGQPALHTLKRFPVAMTFQEYLDQEKELNDFLKATHACTHVREIVVKTHKTLCGNDEYVAFAKQCMIFGSTDPDVVDALLLIFP